MCCAGAYFGFYDSAIGVLKPSNIIYKFCIAQVRPAPFTYLPPNSSRHPTQAPNKYPDISNTRSPHIS